MARSTLTAETLAAVEALDAATMQKAVLEEMLSSKLPPITLIVDNKSLFDTVRTTHLISEKRLLIDMGALRQMVESKEILIKWVSAEKQLADALTKAGASKMKLLRAVSAGKLSDF